MPSLRKAVEVVALNSNRACNAITSVASGAVRWSYPKVETEVIREEKKGAAFKSASFIVTACWKRTCTCVQSGVVEHFSAYEIVT